MLAWLLVGMLLYLAYLFTPLIFLIARVGMRLPLGARDDLPPPSVIQARAERAAKNYQETFAIFLTLGVLALTLPDVNAGLATTGAAISVIARAAFLPLYLRGVAVARTVAWAAYLTGLVLMALALL